MSWCHGGVQGELPGCAADDDLSTLATLTERDILHTILNRFKDKRIYVSVVSV